jgi:HK97 family phage major capsid protein
MIEIVELKRKRMEIVTEQRKKMDIIDARGDGETAEEREWLDKTDNEIDVLSKRIEREDRMIQREAEMARQHYEAMKGGDSLTQGQTRAGGQVYNFATTPAPNEIRMWEPEHKDRLNHALKAWLRSVRSDVELEAPQIEACRVLNLNPRASEVVLKLTPDYRTILKENRDLSLTAGAGGYTVPVGFSNSLERALLAFGGVRQVATVLRTESGNDLHWPTTNDTTNKGEIISEASTFGSSVDPAFAEVIFKAFKYSSKAIKISSELIEDTFFDIASMIGGMMGERIGRIQNDHFTTGAGTTLPKGLTVAGSNGKTGASTNALIADEVIDLQHSVDPAYRPQSSWMFHDTVFAYIRKLKEATTNAYIWQPGMQQGAPDMLLGQRYTINQSMASAFTTGQS